MATNTDTCPHCKADLQGAPIPEEYIQKGYYDPETTHYSRRIGVYDLNTDRTVAWRCPDCGDEWERS